MAGARHSDVIVVGAGHNGLVCAAYLARAGLKVTVLERRAVVGGAAVTEEFHPGFRNSVASYTVSLLQPKIIRDLELPRHGLRIVERELSNFLPTADGRYLASGGDRTPGEIARFSVRDAERFVAYGRELDALAGLLRELALETPVNPFSSDWRRRLPELLKGTALGARLLRHGPGHCRRLLQLFNRSAGDWLDSWFESDPLKALLGFDSIVGNYASPYAPDSAYVLLHHVFGEVNGKAGAWGHAMGGMGAITQAMARAATEAGAEILVNQDVREVLVEQTRAAGVVTQDGNVFRAPLLVSNLNPRLLFLQLLDPALLPADFRRRMEQWRCASGTFRMNVALAELPDFRCLPGKQRAAHHTAGIILAPSLAYMDAAWRDAVRDGWSRQPVVELLIPSTLDPGLAPPGQHVASLFCQHVAPELPDGSSWDLHRDTVAQLMIDTVTEHAPNFRSSVLGIQALSPLDLERTFGLVGGDIFHGALHRDQLYWSRPARGSGDYRSPVPGLYLCGSGSHPGGGVSGAPGHNAAREVLHDLRKAGRISRLA